MSKTDKHEGDYRSFTRASEAFYWHTARREGIEDEVTFGYYSPKGGTSGEVAVCWQRLGDGRVAPQLCAFDDAWSALWMMRDVLAELPAFDDANVSPDAFCALLLKRGFRDRTPRENPRAKGAAPPDLLTAARAALAALYEISPGDHRKMRPLQMLRDGFAQRKAFAQRVARGRNPAQRNASNGRRQFPANA